MRISKLSNSDASRRTAKTKRPPTDDRNRAEAARKRLGIDPTEVVRTRKITPLFRESGLTRERVIEILGADDQEDSIKFMQKWRSISESDLECLSIEEVSIAAGLSTRRLWELISGARMEQSDDARKMIVADSRVRVMNSVIKAATEQLPILARQADGSTEVVGWTNGDMKAAELLWKADGTLPQPKGVSIMLNQQNNAAAPAIADEPELPLVDMDSQLKEFQRVTATAALPAPKEPVTIPVIEAEYEELPLVQHG